MLKHRSLIRAACIVAAAALVGAGAASTAGASTPKKPRAHGPLAISRKGSWLVDASGRVVVLHGFDIVRKTRPWYPSAFSAQDARFLQSEGFNVARIGMAWAAVEPQPGVYDDAYLHRFVTFEHLLARYGIRALVDFHQDLWSAQNMPAWATLGSSYAVEFQHFWNDDAARDGVGIQTHYVRMWQHVARLFRNDTNVLAYDPFNEPQPGYLSVCGPFVQCPQFERGALAAFYARFAAAVRPIDSHHLFLLEPVADNNLTAPALTLPHDTNVGTTFHEYCNLTQTATKSGPQDALCRPVDRRGIDEQTTYARQTLDVPTFVGEFSSSDADDDNATMVDLMGSRFLSWTMWMYYTASTDPANTPGQGLLVDDGKPGSEANAKQAKLDAVAVPYATAIAGTPEATSFNRTTHTYQLTYATTAVPGARLTSRDTTIFLPVRVFPGRVHITVTDGTWSLRGTTLTIRAQPRVTTVHVTVTRA